jgi:hypothetical protein
MIGNPFFEAMFYTSNDELQENLTYAAVIWETLTKKQEPNDDIIGQTLFSSRLDDLWILYQLQKQNWNGFDKDAFALMVKVWVSIYKR